MIHRTLLLALILPVAAHAWVPGRELEADLDGDGRMDRAALTVLPESPDSWDLVVFMQDERFILRGFPGRDAEWKAAHPLATLSLQRVPGSSGLLGRAAAGSVPVPDILGLRTSEPGATEVRFEWDSRNRVFGVTHVDAR